MLIYKRRTNRRALTLIELLVSVSLIGVLMALLIPAVQMTRESSRRSSCANNQRQLTLALHLHESTFGQLPPTVSSKPETFLLFWQAQSLPFMEQRSLYDDICHEVRNGKHVYEIAHRKKSISSLQCPSNPDKGYLIQADLNSFAFTDYCGVAGSTEDDGVFVLDLRKSKKGTLFSQVTNGLSNCLLFGERGPSGLDEGFGAWIGGQMSWSASTFTNGTRSSFPQRAQVDLLAGCGNRTDLTFQKGERGNRCPTHHWSFHSGGAFFARVDGSIDFFAYSIDRDVLAKLSMRH